MGEAEFNQLMRLSNRLAIAAENFAREENLSPVVMPTIFEDMDEQPKLAHKVVDVMDSQIKKICVTLLRYKVDKPQSSNTHVKIFARKKENEKFQQIFYVNDDLEEFIFLPDVMNSVYDKVITTKPICKVP